MKVTKEKFERLVILAEECAEVQHMIMKTLRHGEMESHPDTPNVPNIEMLSEEIADLLFAITWCIEREDMDSEIIEDAFKKRHETISKYLHYNEFNPEEYDY